MIMPMNSHKRKSKRCVCVFYEVLTFELFSKAFLFSVREVKSIFDFAEKFIRSTELHGRISLFDSIAYLFVRSLVQSFMNSKSERERMRMRKRRIELKCNRLSKLTLSNLENR